MENNKFMFSEIKWENQDSAINNPKMQEFIKFRKVQSADFPLIEKLATFPKNLIIAELHNLFNLNQERSGQELASLQQQYQDSERKDLFATFKEFYDRYDYYVCLHLERVLEEI